MKIGYARVSTEEQNLDLQHDALKAAGCEQILTDKVTGAQQKREGLQAALELIGEGDQLVIWKLDRLGRSVPHLSGLFADIEAKGGGVVSLTEGIDTTKAGGKMVYQIMSVLAEFERDIISERTKAGMAASKRRGVKMGRPKALSPAQIDTALMMIRSGESVAVVARSFGVHRSTIYEIQNTYSGKKMAARLNSFAPVPELRAARILKVDPSKEDSEK